jgi:hypothetical protein
MAERDPIEFDPVECAIKRCLRAIGKPEPMRDITLPKHQHESCSTLPKFLARERIGEDGIGRIHPRKGSPGSSAARRYDRRCIVKARR